MTQASLEVLSAFADGDAVDTEALAAALAEPEARATMIEIARLRAAVRSDPSAPSPRFYEAIEGELAVPRPLSRAGRVLRLAAAAVVIVGIGIAAGLALRQGKSRMSNEPPTPTRQIEFVPGVDWFTKS